jgi:hypothetical protein
MGWDVKETYTRARLRVVLLRFYFALLLGDSLLLGWHFGRYWDDVFRLVNRVDGRDQSISSRVSHRQAISWIQKTTALSVLVLVVLGSA